MLEKGPAAAHITDAVRPGSLHIVILTFIFDCFHQLHEAS